MSFSYFFYSFSSLTSLIPFFFFFPHHVAWSLSSSLLFLNIFVSFYLSSLIFLSFSQLPTLFREITFILSFFLLIYILFSPSLILLYFPCVPWSLSPFPLFLNRLLLSLHSMSLLLSSHFFFKETTFILSLVFFLSLFLSFFYSISYFHSLSFFSNFLPCITLHHLFTKPVVSILFRLLHFLLFIKFICLAAVSFQLSNTFFFITLNSFKFMFPLLYMVSLV
ncbi:unnamed protein product [Acanthosepion pharaonis]|uniref:Uncharacterized protein n=1 Tax=Acanthosepion pharaonis TaxID=158019 RepID=A0A812BQQ0_ACAPH|nr:unnamed protein product [Sepia pharaonis]